jgi:copper(I)-binding protein
MNTQSSEAFSDVAVRVLRSAVVPLLACLVTLGALTAWTANGNAGQPRGLEVAQGRILTPLREGSTSAFFTFRNTGKVDEWLTGVKVSYNGSTQAMLSRSIITEGGARTRTTLQDIAIPADDTLKMSPDALNITVTPAPKIEPGDRVRFTLYFADRAPITAKAVAVRPG